MRSGGHREAELAAKTASWPKPRCCGDAGQAHRLGWALIVKPGLDLRVGQGKIHQAGLHCKMCRAGLDLEHIFFLN